MTWIKICGITNREDALASVAAGASAVGFVFYSASPRQIDPQRARAIIESLPEGVEKIGVFVNQAAEEVSRIAEQARLTAVQFHGDEYQKRSLPALKPRILLSVPFPAVVEKGDPTFLSATATADGLLAIMIDSGTKDLRGGTGKAFDWQSAAASISVLQEHCPVVVAGGLTPDNVSQAIGILHPWGVDVASGVEASPGKKDADKVRAFIRAVRLADGKNGN